MLTLDQRLAVVTASNTSLVSRLIELNLLRDRLRKAQLFNDQGGSDLEKSEYLKRRGCLSWRYCRCILKRQELLGG
jgi:hypothetical protein